MGKPKSFRPLAGDLSSLRMPHSHPIAYLKSVSVPLQGTYLPYTL